MFERAEVGGCCCECFAVIPTAVDQIAAGDEVQERDVWEVAVGLAR
jgi:hypothetical protein